MKKEKEENIDIPNNENINNETISRVPKIVKPKERIFFTKKMMKQKQEKENSFLFLSKKTLRFIVEKGEEYNKKKKTESDDMNEGRWTKEEHDKFLDGIVKYGTNWKKVKSLITTRTAIQVRSHAQKFYRKLKMCKEERLGIDFTVDGITSIRDMITKLKSIDNNVNIKYILKYLSDKFDYSKKNKKINNHFFKINLNDSDNNIQIMNNNLNFNLKNEIPTLGDLSQIDNKQNNIYNNIPLNNNTLFNNNIIFNNNNNFFKNILNNSSLNPFLINEINNNNNSLHTILSNLNNPFVMAILNETASLLNTFNNINYKFNNNNNYLNNANIFNNNIKHQNTIENFIIDNNMNNMNNNNINLECNFNNNQFNNFINNENVITNNFLNKNFIVFLPNEKLKHQNSYNNSFGISQNFENFNFKNLIAKDLNNNLNNKKNDNSNDISLNIENTNFNFGANNQLNNLNGFNLNDITFNNNILFNQNINNNDKINNLFGGDNSN